MPSLPDYSIKQLDALTPLPDDFSTVKDGRYVVKTTDSIDKGAEGPEVETKIWLETKVSFRLLPRPALPFYLTT